jgi:hypothetical protein
MQRSAARSFVPPSVVRWGLSLSGRPSRFAWALVGAIAATISGPGMAMGGDGTACPADFNDDEVVDGADLAILLGGWGQPGPTDLNGSGTTDGADLTVVLGSWGACPDPSPTIFTGVVVLADGTPVASAVVVTDFGGSATSGKGGVYELLLSLDDSQDSVTVSAIASLGGTTYQGSQVVSPVIAGESYEVDPIVVESKEEECIGGFGWLPGFAEPGTDGVVRALTVFDDGTGPALYAGGGFTTAGGVTANHIARWDGTSWSVLGSGMDDTVRSLAVFDDGTGPALYAGGGFTTAGGVTVNGIARWDGASWSALGSGMSGGGGATTVRSLAVFDDGTGPALYAGGRFTAAGGVAANRIARWDGTSWSPLGSGMTGGSFIPTVSALTVFDDGTGPALYAGGVFTAAGGLTSNSIARWDGASWSPLGSGISGFVYALTVFDDGTGPALYAGGGFTTAGGVAANRIVRWDGASWSPVGSGMDSPVWSLTVFDTGAGPRLYAGGEFTTAGGVTVNGIARWNGTSWSPLGSGMGGGSVPFVYALKVFDDGTGPALHAGGEFDTAGSVTVNNIARWSGLPWRPLGSGMDGTFVPGDVFALAVFDDGSGPALYAGGDFITAGGVSVSYIARWNGTFWSPLGSGIEGEVFALAVFDDGTGPALYAGGDFDTAGGVSTDRIARWDGTSWSPLGSGLGGTSVEALAVFDDGTGPALYAGGAFATAGGVTANHIARWDGTSWSPLGSGMSGGWVYALAVFDDGTGPALYAGGDFTTAGGVAANEIARWDGTSWGALGSVLSGGSSDVVEALVVFDDGTAPALYAGGRFTAAGGVTVDNIARWDGTSWGALGSGISGGSFPIVQALAVFDDGTGPALYAGGRFTAAGGVTVDGIARWDGTSWSPLGSGVSGEVYALTDFDDGTGPALYVGGDFNTAGGVAASRIAKWGCADP